jgi:hypothetical protein
MQKPGSLSLSRRVYDPKDPSEQHVAIHGKTGICVYSCLTGTGAYGAALSKPEPVRHSGQTCHAGIRRSTFISDLVSNYGGGHKYAKEWWDYITGPECFYQDFFKVPGWEVLTDNSDQMLGFRVPDALMKDGMSLLFYAFLIESRAPKDKVANVNVWGRLVELGVNKKLAHIMMYYLSILPDEQIAIGGTFTGGWTGSHQVTIDGSTDWGMFYRNETHRGKERDAYTRELWSGTGKVLSGEFKQSFGIATTAATGARYGAPTATVYTLDQQRLSTLSEHLKTKLEKWGR